MSVANSPFCVSKISLIYTEEEKEKGGGGREEEEEEEKKEKKFPFSELSPYVSGDNLFGL
jgi:hypothetical protein